MVCVASICCVSVCCDGVCSISLSWSLCSVDFGKVQCKKFCFLSLLAHSTTSGVGLCTGDADSLGDFPAFDRFSKLT